MPKIGELLPLHRMAKYARAIGHEKFCWFVLKDNVRAQKILSSQGCYRRPRNGIAGNAIAEHIKLKLDRLADFWQPISGIAHTHHSEPF